MGCCAVWSGIPARLFSTEYAAKCYFPAIDRFRPQRNMKMKDIDMRQVVALHAYEGVFQGGKKRKSIVRASV